MMFTFGDDPWPSDRESVAVGAILLQQLDIVPPLMVRVTGVASCILACEENIPLGLSSPVLG